MELGPVWWVVVGFAAGIAARRILRSEAYGMIVDLVLGIAGAMAAGVLFRMAGDLGLILNTILQATAGAVLLLWLARRIRKA